jgi:hypothetical protein
MRRRLIWTLLLLAPLVFLGSCSKDSDPAPPAIAGTWARVEYQFSNVPAAYTQYWGNYKLNSFGESGYTIVFKADGTYSRTFTPLISDEGKWTLDGTSLTLKPTDPDDEDAIVDNGLVGLQFKVEGDISDTRLVISQIIKLYLVTDSLLQKYNWDIDAIPDAEYNSNVKAVDVTILYKFNKLK